jgi:nitrite reductase/ring-hydroxylating ferredoxin subunit
MANLVDQAKRVWNKPSLVRVASSDELRGSGPYAMSVEGVDLVVIRTRSGLKAFEGRCPHQGALLGEGELDGETLVCRNHRWRFHAETGKREGGAQCLVACPIVEQDSEVLVDVSALRQRRPTHQAATRTLHDLPGPRGLPLLGNIHQLDLGRLHLILESWAEKYGSPFLFRMGLNNVVAISDAELSEQVLRARPETYRRLANVEPVFKEMCVAGVFSAEGDAWRPQRRLSMQACIPH